jgi:uncharacterized protein YgiM (DUF1202 family)
VPVNEDELAIQENDTVQVLRLVEDGWYEGIYHGKQGVFPSNYVEKINNIENANNSTQPATTTHHNMSSESLSNSSLIESNDANGIDG